MHTQLFRTMGGLGLGATFARDEEQFCATEPLTFIQVDSVRMELGCRDVQ